MPTVKKTHQRKKPTIERGSKPGIVTIDGAQVRKLAKEFRDHPKTVDPNPLIEITCVFTPKGLSAVEIYLGDMEDAGEAKRKFLVEGLDFESAVREMIVEIADRKLAYEKELRTTALSKLTIEEQELLGL